MAAVLVDSIVLLDVATTWRVAVDVTDIGYLKDMATLDLHGVNELLPTRRQWPLTGPG